MPEIDTLLQEQGARWREQVDARVARTSFVTVPPHRDARRRARAWTASLVGAAARGAGLVVADQTNDPPATPPVEGSSASCVAPFLRADPRRSPPGPGHPATLGEVRPGQSVTVYGWWYYAGQCIDVQAPGETIPAASPGGGVVLVLTTSDGRTRTPATVQPGGADASFVATVDIPRDPSLGPATIADGQRHVVELVILGS